MDISNKIQLEWLILADAAQLANNKLNLLGGGWDFVSAPAFPFPKHLGIAVSFQIPWMLTNRQHVVQIEIADQDGQPLLAVEGPMEIGRPVGLPAGQSQRFGLVLDGIVQLAKPGAYVVVARLAGEEYGRTVFNVLPASDIRAA